ncbi:hypothetical protein [Microbispora sp. GKU 823]|uniref:hypothetical protein n=1 Tax=Microbispora sp. GKU 823 TaxID=1652100 RepID=UPI0009CEBFAE|nr:hypothetical protein [Microbispora sp. GKU 823]OPG04473.1 hypothetical protein B1L11_37695 [Microbispora sp. GKU 823]
MIRPGSASGVARAFMACQSTRASSRAAASSDSSGTPWPALRSPTRSDSPAMPGATDPVAMCRSSMSSPVSAVPRSSSRETGGSGDPYGSMSSTWASHSSTMSSMSSRQRSASSVTGAGGGMFICTI